MASKFSPTIENYLGILFVLERDGESTAGVRLAELLGVSPPTVTNTLKRMVRDGLVRMEDGRGARLTDEGLNAARSVMRRHMLTEWLLSRMLAWSKLHSEAHELEHAISQDVENALLESLESPELCPHGNPLPGYEYRVAGWVALPHIPAGETVTIRRIHEMAEEQPDLLAFFEDQHVMPGIHALVAEVLPFNQTLTLHIQGQPVTLGFAAARYVFVERANKN